MTLALGHVGAHVGVSAVGGGAWVRGWPAATGFVRRPGCRVPEGVSRRVVSCASGGSGLALPPDLVVTPM